MKYCPSPRALRFLSSLGALAGLFALPSALSAATGDVTLSGSTWTGKVDGVTKYTGTSLAGATNACVAAMSSGTINIKNAGNVGGSEIRLNSSQKIDGYGNTIQSTSGGGNGIIRAFNKSNVGAVNVKLGGNSWYGMYFQTCSTMTFSGIGGNGGGVAMRIDNCKGGAGSNLSLASPSLGSGGNNAVETMGINTVKWGTVTATDRDVGCGLLLNTSTSCTGTNVNGTRCNDGGGYAGFRMANDNRSTTVSGTVTSVDCGRGFFSLSGSSGSTTARVNATSCSEVGVWIQDCANTKVNAGTIKSTPNCKWVSGSGSYANVSCQ